MSYKYKCYLSASIYPALFVFTLGMATEVIMVLDVGTLMANFLTVGARQVFKQDLIYVFCKADLSIFYKEEERYAKIKKAFFFFDV